MTARIPIPFVPSLPFTCINEVAFAFAAAADKSTPPSQVKTAILYSIASITAVSRVYHDKHWLSDVIMGGTLGYLIGSKI